MEVLHLTLQKTQKCARFFRTKEDPVQFRSLESREDVKKRRSQQQRTIAVSVSRRRAAAVDGKSPSFHAAIPFAASALHDWTSAQCVEQKSTLASDCIVNV
jgi:hypothetical protein